MSEWKYVPNISSPGYGHIEPIADDECELIAQWQAEAIVAKVEQLHDALDQMVAWELGQLDPMPTRKEILDMALAALEDSSDE